MATVPTQADVVVIGGGIVGCSTAYFLAKRGASVVLLEKGEIGQEQSSRAWGFVRQQGRDPAEVPLMVAANAIWRGLSSELNTDIEWVQAGNLAIANDERRVQQFRDWLPVARDNGLDTRVLSRQEIQELIPGIEGPFVGGMYTPSDGHAEPLKSTTALGRGAEASGAHVVTHCAAEGVEVTNGQVSGVVTERGMIRTPVVVCAAGGWSTKIARSVGLSLPQILVRSTVAETTTAAPITGIGVWDPAVAFRQRPSGSFYLARGAISDYDVTLDSLRFGRLYAPNYLKNRNLFRIRVGRALLEDALRSVPLSPLREHPFARSSVEPAPNLDTAWRSLQGLKSRFPALADIGIKRVFAGLIDTTPDAVPVLGEVDQPGGFILATGFSGHGFAMGPIAGKLVSEIILDGKPSLDIHEMRFSRFKEGDLARPKNVL